MKGGFLIADEAQDFTVDVYCFGDYILRRSKQAARPDGETSLRVLSDGSLMSVHVRSPVAGCQAIIEQMPLRLF